MIMRPKQYRKDLYEANWPTDDNETKNKKGRTCIRPIGLLVVISTRKAKKDFYKTNQPTDDNETKNNLRRTFIKPIGLMLIMRPKTI